MILSNASQPLLTSAFNRHVDTATIDVSRVYLPVCIYTKSLTRKDIARSVIYELAKRSTAIAVVVADDLHAIGKTNRGLDYDRSLFNSRVIGANLKKMYENIGTYATEFVDMQVFTWADLTRSHDYIKVYERLSAAAETDHEFYGVIRSFVTHHLSSTGLPINHLTIAREQEYIFQEISASICMTEIRKFYCEIWEKLPSLSAPDPLGYLYNYRNDIVSYLVDGPNLIRSLHSLDQIITFSS